MMVRDTKKSKEEGMDRKKYVGAGEKSQTFCSFGVEWGRQGFHGRTIVMTRSKVAIELEFQKTQNSCVFPSPRVPGGE